MGGSVACRWYAVPFGLSMSLGLTVNALALLLTAKEGNSGELFNPLVELSLCHEMTASCTRLTPPIAALIVVQHQDYCSWEEQGHCPVHVLFCTKLLPPLVQLWQQC